jgi:hypothetical protein
MGFKARERKRRKRAATNAAQSAARASGSSAGKWWLTIATRDCCCARCRGIHRIGREIVFRYRPKEVLCVLCAEADPTIKPKPSLRWEHNRDGHRRERPQR